MVAPAVPEYVAPVPVYVFPGLRTHGNCPKWAAAAAAQIAGIVTDLVNTT